MKCINFLDVVCDSRGVKLQKGDCVIVLYDGINSRFGYIEEYYYDDKIKLKLNIFGGQYLSSSVNCIKVPNYTLDDYKDYYDKIVGDKVGLNCAYLSHILACIRGQRKLDKTQNPKIVAKMIDMLGRDLHCGDMVAYITNHSTVSYGLVLSETHVLTEYGKKAKLNFVCLLPDRTQEEEEIYKKLVMLYKRNSQVMTLDRLDVQVGDVFMSGSYYYIYLGRCNVSFKYKNPVNIMYTCKYDESKGLWLKFKLNDTTSIEDYLYSHPFSTVICHILNNDKSYKLQKVNLLIPNTNTYASYYRVIELKPFVQDIKTKLSRVCHIDIDSTVYFNFYNQTLVDTGCLITRLGD